MKRYLRGHLLLASVALLLGPISRGEAPRPTAIDVEQLIRQLGSDKFEEREAASKALERIGEPAFPALRKAAGRDDAEVRRRARRVMEATYARLAARDTEALQGTWVLQTVEWMGEKTEQDALPSDPDLRWEYLYRKVEERELPQDRKQDRVTLTVKGNAFTFEGVQRYCSGFGRGAWGGMFALDLSKGRKVMERRYEGSSETCYSLYSVEGDTMRWCMKMEGGPDLPAKFATDGDPDVYLLTFQRERT